MNLDEIRAKIDKVDKSLLENFEQRMGYVKDVADYKIKNRIPIYSGAREKEIIDLAISRLKNPDITDYTREFFTSMMNISKELQTKISGEENLRLLKKQGGRIVYQGVEGSYSGQAAVEFFGEDAVAESVDSFKDVCVQVAGGKARFGVLPIENSITGSVLEVIDRIEEFDCHVVGEYRMRIKHCLMGLPDAELSDIQTVFSHPQGLSQCRDYILENKLSPTEAKNTAMAAKQVK
ncbi:MAG: chorismate mutase, partial [Eubacteriales bacterium]